jgi:hypothetical protein
MANEPILAVEENIDEQIIEFCATRPGLSEEQVVRDIARIVCIVNLVANGTLDGENTVLCGGMAMRCLDSPRMSVFDGAASTRSTPRSAVVASRSPRTMWIPANRRASTASPTSTECGLNGQR